MRYKKPEDMVADALKDCLPPRVPVSYKKIVSAKFVKGIKEKQVAQAQLEMFDGKKAEVRVSTWSKDPKSWVIEWLRMDGGPAVWKDGKWVRISA